MKKLIIRKTETLTRVARWLSQNAAGLEKYRDPKGNLDLSLISTELRLHPRFYRTQQMKILLEPHLKASGGLFTKLGLGQIAKVDELPNIASARAPTGQISLNSLVSGVVITKQIKIQEIESMVQKEEELAVAKIWNELMLQEREGKLSFLNLSPNPGGTNRVPIMRRTLTRALLIDQGDHRESSVARPHRVEPCPKGTMSQNEQAVFAAFLRSDVRSQRKFLVQHTPTSFRELMTWVDAAFHVSFWDCRPSAVNIEDPELWIKHLAGCIFSADPHEGIFNRAFLFRLAFQLKRSGHVLWPSGTISALGRASGGRKSERNTILRHLEQDLTLEAERRFPTVAAVAASLTGGAAHKCRAKLKQLLFCTDLSDEKHISRIFAESPRIRRFGFNTVARGTLGPWSLVLDKLVVANDPFGIQKATPTKNRFVAWVDESLGKRSEPQAREWSELFIAYDKEVISQDNVKRNNRRIYELKTLLDWIVKDAERSKRIVGPLKITRDLVWPTIAQEGSFKSFLIQAFPTWQNPWKKQNQALVAARGFFSFVHDKNPKFRNPLFSTDRFRGSTRTKTLRLRVPSTVLRSIRDSILVRAEGQAGIIPIGWSEFVQSIPYFSERVLIEGQVREVFCPILPAIFWLAAQWPLRQSQITWLDSGELDEFIYDFSAGDFVKNLNPNALPRREAGVIAKVDDSTEVGDSFGPNHSVDFRVQRNKRRITEKSEYTIPYMDSSTLWVIQQVLEWHRRYGIPPKLVKESHNDSEIKSWDDEPDFAPLFRLPRNQGIFPPTSMQLAKAWSSFCQAFDRRVGVSEGDQLTVTDVHNPLAHLRNRTIPKYDLHNLRVGGISDLLDRGLPLALVAAIAGHRSISMTLYYYKIDRQHMRVRLSEALRSDPRLAQLAGDVYRLLQAGDDSLLNQLVGNIAVLKNALTGHHPIEVSSRGICPATRCEEGLKSSSAVAGSWGTLVPGSLCPLCQFWITGTMFLPGLVKWLNELLEELETAAQRQAALFDEMTKLDAEGKTQEARQLRSEQEYLERYCLPKGAAVARLYEIITELCKRWEANPGKETDATLLVPNAVSMHPRLECIGRFEKIHEMQVLDHILPNQTTDIGRRITAEHTLELMRILEKYGASRFYLGLPPDLHRAANIALGDFMIKVVPSADDLEAVYTRKKVFSDVLAGQSEQEIENALKRIGASLQASHLNRSQQTLTLNN